MKKTFFSLKLYSTQKIYLFFKYPTVCIREKKEHFRLDFKHNVLLMNFSPERISLLGAQILCLGIQPGLIFQLYFISFPSCFLNLGRLHQLESSGLNKACWTLLCSLWVVVTIWSTKSLIFGFYSQWHIFCSNRVCKRII